MSFQSEVINRIVQLIHTCVPAENLSSATWPALACVVVGLILVFCGAKVIRGLLILMGGIVGGYAGYVVAGYLGKPVALCVVSGGVAAVLISLVLVKLWIVLLSGVLAGSVALIVFCAYEGVPRRFEEFARHRQTPVASADSEFPLPDHKTASARSTGGILEVVGPFVEELHRRRDPLLRDAVICVATAALVGGVLGVVLVRWTMILWTSLVGIGLAVGGGGVLIAGPRPEWHDYVIRHAAEFLLATSVVWFLGMLVQWHGTRMRSAGVSRPPDAFGQISGATH